MADQRQGGIAWTDHTWPIINGCRRKSTGCVNCYAERLAATRLKHHPKYKGLAEMKNGQPQWTGETRLWEKDLLAPLKIRKPSKIFVANMGDLFYEGVSDEDIDKVFAVMIAGYHHTFQVLTKRPERMREYMRTAEMRVCEAGTKMARTEGWCHANEDEPWPPKNIWLGVSAENQETANERIPFLLETPAAIRWVSYEPALSQVDFTRIEKGDWLVDSLRGGFSKHDLGTSVYTGKGLELDWIVCGGESGHNARPFDIEWARSVRDQCKAAGVSFFMKQLGAKSLWPDIDTANDIRAKNTKTQFTGRGDGYYYAHLETKSGSEPSEWPEDLRIQEFPQ